MTPLKALIWNARGVSRKLLEIGNFAEREGVDIIMLSETKTAQIGLYGFDVYTANHPDGAPRGGAAILINRKIRHVPIEPIVSNRVQLAGALIQTDLGEFLIGAIYCPPGYSWTATDFDDILLATNSTRYLIGGDWNAKHAWWGSQIISSRGNALATSAFANNADILATGSPTYFSSQAGRRPSHLDFAIFRGIPRDRLMIQENWDLDSDHLALILSVNAQATLQSNRPKLLSKCANISTFKEALSRSIELNLSFNSAGDIDEAIDMFNAKIHQAANRANEHETERNERGARPSNHPVRPVRPPPAISGLLATERAHRRVYLQTLHPLDKAQWHRSARELREALVELRQARFERLLSNMDYTKDASYSIWSFTKNIKTQPKRITPL